MVAAQRPAHSPFNTQNCTSPFGTQSSCFLTIYSTGCKVIAISSPHNFALLKSYGADEVYDYKSPTIGTDINAATSDSLTLAFDTISEKGSPEICAAALSSKGGKYTSLLPVTDFPRQDIKPTFTLAYTALGEWYMDKFPASQTDWEFAVKFWRLSEELINSGKIRAHKAEVREGGLDAIPQGLQDLKENKVSGVKLVYQIE
jgi:NADPH:quinone reductase-like Zn-dependent oxidoreductase